MSDTPYGPKEPRLRYPDTRRKPLALALLDSSLCGAALYGG